jgi:glyoxylase-like metal-dependent hydrolase (beta-lactamase superfamily II)
MTEEVMLPIKKIDFNVGGYHAISVPTGVFGLDGGAMFGTVPKLLWEKFIPSDEKNRIPMEARVLLLKGNQRNILIDTGNGCDFIAKYGEKLGSKFASLYNISETGSHLLERLAQHNVSPSDVTDVILTHLHFDHAGGATCFDPKSGKVRPTFQNATYYIQKENLDVALNPNIREKASYLKSNIDPLLESGQLKILHGPQQNVLPNIHLQISHGHTKGQQNVVITDETNGLFYGADLIPTHAHVRLAWIMGYDLEPLTLIEEKKRALTEIAQKKWLLFLEHDPYFDACSVVFENQDFKVDQGFQFQ